MTRKAPRPAATVSFTVERLSHCGKLYVTVTTRKEKPFEVFIRFGKAGGCSSAMADGVARLVSYGLRSGLNPLQAVKALSGIACQHGPRTCLNEVAAALRLVLQHLESGESLETLIDREEKAAAS